MKNLLLSIASLVLCQSVNAANDYIVQTDLESGLTYYIYIQGPDTIGEKTGVVPSSVPIGSKGARFQLYGVGLEPDSQIFLLSETVVGAFLPGASVAISSEDPYKVVPRTRADEPFTASMSFSNLSTSTDPEIPESAKVVYVERLAVEYPEGEDRVSVTGSNTERVLEAFYVTQNGVLERPLTTSLTSAEAHKQKGEELIRVYALPNQDLGWTIIDEQKIHIWPIADGEIKGVKSDGSVFELDGQILNEIPNISMSVSDLYPTSKTFLRIYKGNKVDEAVEIQTISQIIADDYNPLSFNTTVPQSAAQFISSAQWEQYAEEDGLYTVEVVTITPFNGGNPERMAYATFTLKRKISVKGALISAE